MCQNGDPRWHRTYMNVPRYVDLLLEECGSQRFYARGEANEPHAPTNTARCRALEWADGMWKALQAVDDLDLPPVRWDAAWAHLDSPVHHEVVEWAMPDLVRRHGELKEAASIFARPDDIYAKVLEDARKLREERKQRQQARKRE
jgi:hypothetical protein